MASFDDYDGDMSQGELSSGYSNWVEDQIQNGDAAGWIGFLYFTKLLDNGASHDDAMADALALIETLKEGNFELSDLFTAANLNTKKVDEDDLADARQEIQDNMKDPSPTIQLTGEGEDIDAINACLSQLDLSVIFGELTVHQWDTENKNNTIEHYRAFYGEMKAPADFDDWQNDDPDPVFFTLNFNSPLSIVADVDDYTDNRDNADGIQGLDGDDLLNTDAPHGTNGGNGKDAIEITNTEPYDGIWINSGGDTANELYGGSGGNGGMGSSDSGTLIDGNYNDETDAADDGGDGGNGGNGGHAIFNGDLNNVIILGDQDLTILGGDGGIGGKGGEGGDFHVDGNANSSKLSGGDGGDGGDGGASGDGTGGGGGDGGDPGTATVDGNTNVHTVLSSGSEGTAGASYPDGNPIIGAFSHRVDVDASDFEGALTISGSNYWEGETSGDDTMIFGAGITVVYATTGDDYYDVSNGAVTVTYTWHGQSDGAEWTDTIQGWGDNDIIDVSGIYDGVLTWVDDGALGAFSIGWFEENDNTYVVADVNGNGTADFKVELLGTDLNLSASDFVL